MGKLWVQGSWDWGVGVEGIGAGECQSWQHTRGLEGSALWGLGFSFFFFWGGGGLVCRV